MSAVRDQQGRRGRPANRESGAAGQVNGSTAGRTRRSERTHSRRRARIDAETRRERRREDGRGASGSQGWRRSGREEEKEGQEMR
jgi:hypothetical protein